jgi:hypothetical protein
MVEGFVFDYALRVGISQRVPMSGKMTYYGTYFVCKPLKKPIS